MVDADRKEKPIPYKKVKTEVIWVTVTLIDGTRVEGCFHLTPNLRLIDMLNRHTADSPFLAVTDAKVIFPNGERGNYNFFSLNRSMIVCCFPQEEEVMESSTYSL